MFFLEIQLHESSPTFWQGKRVGIIALKFKEREVTFQMTVFTDVTFVVVSQNPLLSNINFTGVADVIFFVLLSVFFSSPSPFFLQPFVFVFPSRL